MKAIVYTSNTGHTKKYAEILAEKTGLAVYNLEKDTKLLPKGSDVIFLGWLFVSSIKGYKKAKRLYNVKAVCGVGLCDTGCMLEEVRKAIKLPKYIPLFTVQGGINKPKLKGINKFMIDMLIKMMESKDEKSDDDKRMLELLNNDCDYVCEENLKDLISWYNEL